MSLRFSILVPTRQRPDTLLATLATLIWQPGDDYEIVVADNFGDQDVAAVIAAAQQRHPRIRHVRTDRVLPMAENWERGLAACSGEYVSVLGDDDGFLPSTLDVVRKLIAATDARIVSWETHTYWWPDTVVFWARNRLYALLGNYDVAWIQSRPALVETYRNPVSFERLPMIYNGFVHRDVINSAIDRFGGYFVPTFVSPDVSSGIINLSQTGRYLHSFRPLAVRGISKRSTGASFWARSLGSEQQNIYLKEEGRTIEQTLHPSMTVSKNVGFCVASLKLHLKDLLFPHDDELRIDLGTVVKHMLAGLNDDPEAYDDNLAEAFGLAEKIGFTVDPAAVPANTHTVRKPLQGPVVSGANVAVGVNCDIANVFDVAGAARLVEAMSSEPALRVVQWAAVAEPQDRAS
jgi:glycosyltransferase involved in cell wall biosynthesis